MRTKIISYFLVMLMVLASLVGCAGTGINAPTQTTTLTGATTAAANKDASLETTASNKPVKLVWWSPYAIDVWAEDFIADYKAIEPNVEIEYIRYVNDDQGNLKLDTALMAGEQIDLFYSLYEDLTIKRIENGVVEDLTPYIAKSGIDLGAIQDDFAKYNGKLYGLPTNKSIHFVYLNKNMFEQEGVPIPDDDWTLDDYIEISKRMTKVENGVTTRYGGMWTWKDVCLNLVHRPVIGADSYYNSEGMSNFDHPVFKESLDLMVKVMLEDKSHMKFTEVESSKLTRENEFLNGKVAMVTADFYLVNRISNLEQYPHDFVTYLLPFPTIKEGQKNYYFKGLAGLILMTSYSKHKDEAFDLIKHVTMEGSLYVARSGKLPTWEGVDENEFLKAALGEKMNELYDIDSFKFVLFDEKTRQKIYSNSNFAAFSEIEDIWRTECEKVISGQESVSDAILNAKNNADKAIKSAR